MDEIQTYRVRFRLLEWLLILALSLVYIFQARATIVCSINCGISDANESACDSMGNCLYGCVDGYTGPKCGYQCMDNCQNCSLMEVMHTCPSTNSKEVECHECKDNFFLENGMCAMCTNCRNPPNNPSSLCDVTGTCIYGCDVGFTGDRCDISCEKNCLNCTLLSASTNDIICNECEEHFYANGSKCVSCEHCMTSSDMNVTSKCDDDGICMHGCDLGYTGPKCDVGCEENCVNCSLKSGTLDQTNCETCMEHFYVNASVCVACEHCMASSDENVTSKCDVNGTCLHGCDVGHIGPRCDVYCGDNCINCTLDSENVAAIICNDCNQNFYANTSVCIACEYCMNSSDDNVTSKCDVNGTCLHGCDVGYMGPRCDVYCGDNCIDCTIDSENVAAIICNECNQNFYANISVCIACEHCMNSSDDNVTSKCDVNGTCIHGCDVGYIGPRCDVYCGNFCSNCSFTSNSSDTTECLACENHSFLLDGVCQECSSCRKPANGSSSCMDGGYCVDGCVGAFTGPKCQVPCGNNCTSCSLVSNSTVDTECSQCDFSTYLSNGSCLSCGENCRLSPDNSAHACDDEGACLLGCRDTYGGKWCNISCGIHRCLQCTIDSADQSTIFCDKCAPHYYLSDGGKACTNCKGDCLPDPDGQEPRCQSNDGFCKYGCTGGGKCGRLCQNGCGGLCVNGQCDRTTCCCTEGCVLEGYTGCGCNEKCQESCVDGLCYQNGTCTCGCKPNFWNNKCQLCQTGCKDDEDNSTTICNSVNGHCIDGCVNDTIWGVFCDQSCPINCINGTCDRFDESCTYGCADGWYGDKCEKQCNVNCKNTTCSRDFGNCAFGCNDKWYGQDCSKECPENCAGTTCDMETGFCTGCNISWHGTKCTQSCSQHCNNSNCDQVTTFCTEGCIPANKRWGKNCEEECSINCKNGDCFHNNGTCMTGCERSWYGDRCGLQCSGNCRNDVCHRDGSICLFGCKNGYFGGLCTRECWVNCFNNTCGVNGTCALGCIEGFSGDRCDIPDEDENWKYAAGGAAGVVLIGIIVAIIVLRKRERRQAIGKAMSRVRTRIFSTFDPTGDERRLNRRRKNQDDETDAAVGIWNPFALEVFNHAETRGVYIKDLLAMVSGRTRAKFNDEFMKLDLGLLKSHDVALQPENTNKNFYTGVVPYDENRVTLWTAAAGSTNVPSQNRTSSHLNKAFIGDQEIEEGCIVPQEASGVTDGTGPSSDYINATFIKCGENEKHYIAAQGPSQTTFNDFWQMIWQEKSSMIVMMTSLPVGNGQSFQSFGQRQSGRLEKYWPEPQQEANYGPVAVRGLAVITFADFVIKTFTVTRDHEERVLTQLQLTCWEENARLPSTTNLVEFHRKFRLMTSLDGVTGPVVVHCTDGVGKTGVFIGLDLLVEESLKEGAATVDVPAVVQNLRQQRTNMVSSVELYEYLYKVAAHSLTLHCEPIERSAIPRRVQELMLEPDNTPTQMRVLFNNCNEAVCLDDPEIEAVNRFDERVPRDRPTSDIPDLRYRPTLYNQAYINAVYIDSYKTKDSIIATQMPTPHTVEDFCNLVIQKKCTTIVMLNPEKEAEDFVTYWPTSTDTVTHGNVLVTCTNTQTRPTYIIRNLKMENQRASTQDVPGVSHEVTMLQFTAWLDSSQLPSGQEMMDFVKFVRSGSLDNRLIVHCLNGSEQTGLFCVLYNLLEKLEHERELSIVTTIGKVKTRRPTALPTYDQFKFCHETLSEFLSTGDVPNFGDYATL